MLALMGYVFKLCLLGQAWKFTSALQNGHFHELQEQELLQKPDENEPDIKLGLVSHDFIEFSTEMAVGSPPQRFRAMVDLASSSSFVPSVKCDEPVYCDPHPLYDSSKSSTYAPNGTRVRVVGGGFYAWGNISIDSFHLDGREIYNQVFDEADIVHPDYFFDDTWYDAVLPLARTTVPIQFDSNMSVPSVFENIMQQKTLKHNTIAFKFPRTAHEEGEMQLGIANPINTTNDKEAIHLPILRNVSMPPGPSSNHICGGWYAEAVSAKFDSTPDPIFFNLSGYIAVFRTVNHLITLPSEFTDPMYDFLGADDMFGMPCEEVHDLPDLTITLKGELGKNHEFILHGEDYLPKLVRLPLLPADVCSAAVGSNDWDETPVPNYINLGSWFLNKYYTVFDADEMLISMYPLD